MHTYRIDAYLLDERGQNPTFERTQYADNPEQARLIFKNMDDQKVIVTDPDTGEVTKEYKKYLVRLLLGGYTMCNSPAAHFAEFGL